MLSDAAKSMQAVALTALMRAKLGFSLKMMVQNFATLQDFSQDFEPALRWVVCPPNNV
jgi:hypothetical protein